MGIEFKTSINEGIKLAEKENKLLYIDFFHIDCGGCKALGNIVYPHKNIEDLITSYTIPVRISVTANPKDAEEYNVAWFPNLRLGRVKNGKFIEDYRYIGYLPPEDFIPTIKVAIGISNFNDNKFEEADKIFTEIIEKYPGTQQEAEALYWLGVTRYKMKQDPSPLKERWNVILTKYPTSIWAKKASFIKQ